MTETADRYLVISSDGHAGAPFETYKSYLPVRYHEDFEAWRAEFDNPWDDLRNTETREYRRNFDSAVRQADIEGDGIVGEVLYPNTIPPFHESGLRNGADVRDAAELDRRWAGIHAHNQWLVDFCAETPGRRAGVAQILLDDVDRALEEVRWVAEQGFTGGVLIPNPGVQSAHPQLHSPAYEPVWAECEALGLLVHTHGGGGVPDYGPHPASGVMTFLEFGWYALRPLVRLMFSGVFERHPDLTFVMTEIGNGQIPGMLAELDTMAKRVRGSGLHTVENHWAGPARELSLLPSEYWARQCRLGASLMTHRDAEARHEYGVDTLMWGADYPHAEGTHPYTREAYRHTFAGIDQGDVAKILGLNAASVFGFDAAALAPVAAEIGPQIAEVDRPLAPDEFPPADAASMSFPRRRQTRSA